MCYSCLWGKGWTLNKVIDTDFYIISNDYKLLFFNASVAKRYEGIKCGDLCYKATMKRGTPCKHCPIAGNSKDVAPIYFDPFYGDWVEAIFSDIGENRFAVTCRLAQEYGRDVFQSLKKNNLGLSDYSLDNLEIEDVGMIGGYCEDGFPLYYVNDYMIKMLGYEDREDFYAGINGKVLNTIHPDDLPQVVADLGNEYYVGMKYETTYRMPRKDGSWLWTIDRGEVIRAADGRLAIISACLDVTEAKELKATREREERASQAKEQLLAAITKLLYAYNLTVDVNTGKYTIIKGNGLEQSVRYLSSNTDYDVIYKAFYDHIDNGSHARFQELLSIDNYRGQFVKEGLIGTEEFYVKLPDGGMVWQELNVIAGFDKDNQPILHILGRDVTEAHDKANTKAQLEIAKAANAAKSTFLFNMSHDIRTPMNAIVGFTELLKKHLDDRELTQGYIGKIETANNFLLALVNNVLEMARIESGKALLDETPHNIYEFSDSIYSLFEKQMKDKNITFTQSIDVQHHMIMVDETKMRQIMLNILSNAVKYTPEGGSISVAVTELASTYAGYVVNKLVIEDNGIGMSEAFLPHIFEDFTRERTSTESKVIGTGLGMPIVKKLVELMHGTIEVESKLGKGTRFTVTTTHRIAETAAEMAAQSCFQEYDMQAFASKRILLAEDNELNAEIAQTILEEAGFLVEHAKDGIICVDMLEKAEPGYYDLVLMDIQMPNMDGYKATQVIRKLYDTSKANIPIIAMTANAFEEDRKNAFRVGMNGHVVKPIQVDKLISTINNVLSLRERQG